MLVILRWFLEQRWPESPFGRALQNRLHVKPYQSGCSTSGSDSKSWKLRSLEQFGQNGATISWLRRLRVAPPPPLLALPSGGARRAAAGARPAGRRAAGGRWTAAGDGGGGGRWELAPAAIRLLACGAGLLLQHPASPRSRSSVELQAACFGSLRPRGPASGGQLLSCRAAAPCGRRAGVSCSRRLPSRWIRRENGRWSSSGREDGPLWMDKEREWEGGKERKEIRRKREEKIKREKKGRGK